MNKRGSAAGVTQERLPGRGPKVSQQGARAPPQPSPFAGSPVSLLALLADEAVAPVAVIVLGVNAAWGSVQGGG